MKELSDKEKRFCQEYVFDWNASRAARVAGYSEKSCGTIGCEMLKKPHIEAQITAIQLDMAKLTGESMLKVIAEYKKIAYSSLQNYNDDWLSLKQWETVSDEDKAAVAEVSYTKDGVKFKLHDKQRALENISKLLGFNAPSRMDLTSQGERLDAGTSTMIENLAKIILGDLY